VNIKEIAKLADTSVATVSRVINNTDGKVSEAVRLKVLKVIEETGYRPNNLGRSLRKQQSKKLLIMLPTINLMYSDMVASFEEEARKQGYSVLLAMTNRRADIERNYYDMLYTKQVDGVASFIPAISHGEISKIARQYPFIACCWRGLTDDIDASYVCIDNEKASYDIVNYLIRLGHKRIAIFYDNRSNRFFDEERKRGYLRSLSEAGIDRIDDYIVLCESSYSSAYKKCPELFSLKEPPTAIFATSDERAVGIVKWMHENNYKVGEDVDVVGFDNLPYSDISIPGITTMAQPLSDIGREAANLLISRIDDPDKANKGIILSHKLIVRESTRKPMPAAGMEGEGVCLAESGQTISSYDRNMVEHP
jgi:DNA-binding LacI/PurR family transcriptional regulator